MPFVCEWRGQGLSIQSLGRCWRDRVRQGVSGLGRDRCYELLFERGRDSFGRHSQFLWCYWLDCRCCAYRLGCSFRGKLGLFFRAQGLVSLPFCFFLVRCELARQLLGFCKVQPCCCPLLRAHSNPFVHSAVHYGLVSSRQIWVALGYFEPLAFLWVTDAAPSCGEWLEALLLQRAQLRPTGFRSNSRCGLGRSRCRFGATSLLNWHRHLRVAQRMKQDERC